MTSGSRTAALAALMLLSACNLARDLDEVEFVERSDGGVTDTGGGGQDDSGNGGREDTGSGGDTDIVPDSGGTDMGDTGSTLTCTPAVTEADVSSPTTVVGNGDPTGCTQTALQNALDNGGVVTFDCGANMLFRLTEELVISNPVVVDGGGSVTLSGNRMTRVVRIVDSVGAADVQLQNISIIDGADADVTTPCGAGILQEASSLSLYNVELAGNECEMGAGGALATGDGFVVNLHRVTFDSNVGEIGGGAGGKGHTLSVSDSSWINNSATEGGGLWSSGRASLCGVRFEQNSAKGGGAMAISTNDPLERVDIDQAIVAFNDGTTEGGGLLIAGAGMVTVTRSAFVDNTSANGGGIMAHEGKFELENVTVARNRATERAGGGILVTAAEGVILSSTIVYNDAVDAIGGLLVEGGVELGNTIVGGNTANENPDCSNSFRSLGGNVQFPDPGENGALCTEDIRLEDLELTISSDGYSYVPADGSAATMAGVSCPPDDQLGNARPAQRCAAGAIEP